MNTKSQKWEDRISQIKKELQNLGDMRPGTLSKQYNVCGKPNCRCKDPKNPVRHGPYFQLSYTYQGKSTTEFVKKERLKETQMQLRNYMIFKKLTEEWVALSLRIAKLRKKLAGK